MQTRCPNCNTLYRVDQDELDVAGGQVSCYRCDTVFNAYEREVQDLEQALDNLSFDSLPDSDQDDDDSQTDSTPLEDSVLLASSDSNLEPVSESVADDLGLSGLADEPDEAEGQEPDSLDLDDLELDDTPFHQDPVEEALADADHAALEQDLAPPPPERKTSLATLLGRLALILLLCLTAVAQLGWQLREQLLTEPATRRLAEQACTIADCTLPLIHAPEAYRVVQRRLAPAPGRGNALMLELAVRNEADFPQLLPDLQLSLFDREEKLLARRRLKPGEYLFPAQTEGVAVAAKEVITIELVFEDPGNHASGFKLEFL